MFKEFKEFAFKGDVIDLAIGIVIGAAFGAIIKSFVDNIINPLIGLIGGGKAALDGLAIHVTPTVSNHVWSVPQRGSELPDRCLRALPHREGGQHVPRRRGGHRARVPALPDAGPEGRHPLLGMHVGARRGVGCFCGSTNHFVRFRVCDTAGNLCTTSREERQ